MGKSFFIKINASTPSLFATEALGLQEIADSTTVPVPRVIDHGEDFILLSWIERGALRPHTLRDLGSSLAQMHRTFATDGFCGWKRDNFIGSTPQINGNPQGLPWAEFFCEKRLKFQWELMQSKGKSSPTLDRLLPSVLDKSLSLLEEVDEEGHSLLHGDLWSGNYLVDREGQAYVIDPAVYYGHREADLAMTRLFGEFPGDFYRGYEEEWPLTPGSGERLFIYQLYHLLNHVNLFGSGYLRETEGAALNIINA